MIRRSARYDKFARAGARRGDSWARLRGGSRPSIQYWRFNRPNRARRNKR